MTQVHYGCPNGQHDAGSCDGCDTCRKANILGLCKSGRHVWIDEESAAKCCNGYRRELVIVQQRSDLLEVQSGTLQYEPESEAWFGRRWVKEEA